MYYYIALAVLVGIAVVSQQAKERGAPGPPSRAAYRREIRCPECGYKHRVQARYRDFLPGDSFDCAKCEEPLVVPPGVDFEFADERLPPCPWHVM